jgi:hypothetical protein
MPPYHRLKLPDDDAKKLDNCRALMRVVDARPGFYCGRCGVIGEGLWIGHRCNPLRRWWHTVKLAWWGIVEAVKEAHRG